MNILCIVNEIGDSAAGQVFDTIIKELSTSHNVYIICPNAHASYSSHDTITLLPTISPPKKLRWSLSMSSALLFGLNINDYIGAKKHIKEVGISTLPHIDSILSFVSSQRYFGLILGKYLSKHLQAKWAVYSVDPIPAPYPWTKNYFLRKRIEQVFRRLAKRCDLFMSSNLQMLQYQLKILKGFQGHTEVIHTPIYLPQHNYKPNNSLAPSFLYTGHVYGLRRIDNILSAFRLLLEDFPNAKIVFVGHNSTNLFATYQDLINFKSLEIHKFATDLSTFYDNSTVLLDINADIDNDVFLSSKIINYLVIPKPIISISGANSPSRQIFTNDNSIIHCNHKVEEIYKAFKRSLSIKEQCNREHYIRMFSSQHICKVLIKALENIND